MGDVLRNSADREAGKDMEGVGLCLGKDGHMSGRKQKFKDRKYVTECVP